MLFPIVDLPPPDALRYRDVDSHPRKLCATRGALGLVVGEGLDGLRLAVDFSLPPTAIRTRCVPAQRISIAQPARIADWDPAPCRRPRRR